MDPKAVYECADVVATYEDADYLEAPERHLVENLGAALPSMSMLDIAVGAGRTTRYFAPLVRRYVGVDFSTSMIDLCVRKFSAELPNASFMVADMRDLSCVGEERFDLVLISYNSISSLDHEDRLRVFQNVRSVCRPGARFLFSAHNLHCLPRLFGVPQLLSQLSFREPRGSCSLLRTWFMRRFVYEQALSYRRWMRDRYRMLNDGAHFGRLHHYYVTAEEQVAQLSKYFDEVSVYRANGEQLQIGADGGPPDDYWLFYLCNTAATPSLVH